jgi:hypothetical protein
MGKDEVRYTETRWVWAGTRWDTKYMNPVIIIGGTNPGWKIATKSLFFSKTQM